MSAEDINKPGVQMIFVGSNPVNIFNICIWRKQKWHHTKRGDLVFEEGMMRPEWLGGDPEEIARSTIVGRRVTILADVEGEVSLADRIFFRLESGELLPMQTIKTRSVESSGFVTSSILATWCIGNAPPEPSKDELSW